MCEVGVTCIVLVFLTFSISVSPSRAATSPQTFTRDLQLGSQGEDVRLLQQFLNTHGAPVALTGPGSAGQESTMFGSRTLFAVRAYQTAHAKEIGAPRGTGLFGPLTRAYINGLLAPLPLPAAAIAPQKLLPTITPTHTISGTVNGEGGMLLLQLNEDDVIQVNLSQETMFAFTYRVMTGKEYRVFVVRSPAGQTCTIDRGQGIVADADITNISVTCHKVFVPQAPAPSVSTLTPVSDQPTYALGGQIRGVRGEVVLENTNGDVVTITENSPDTFVFPKKLPSYTSYRVSVLSVSEGQACYVNSTGGMILDADASVLVICVPSWASDPFGLGDMRYMLRGTVSGSTGPLVLQNNGAFNLVLTGDGSFTFPGFLSEGDGYDVTVMSPPSGQVCSVENGSGAVEAGGVSVNVVCEDL